MVVAIFDGTGRYVITGSDDRLVKLWSAETGLCLRSCRGHEVFISIFHFPFWHVFLRLISNFGLVLALAFPFGSPPTHSLTKAQMSVIQGDITDLAVSNRNKYVASASNDFVIRVVSLPLFLLLGIRC